MVTRKSTNDASKRRNKMKRYEVTVQLEPITVDAIDEEEATDKVADMIIDAHLDIKEIYATEEEE